MKNMKRIKDITNLTAEEARYVIRRICMELSDHVPTDAEIGLDGFHAEKAESYFDWYTMHISAVVCGKLCEFTIDLLNPHHGRNTLCCNPNIIESRYIFP